jgi:hypothetical protein
VASILVTVLLPLLVYPFAKTTWSAIDLLMNRMDDEDIRALIRATPPAGGGHPR